MCQFRRTLHECVDWNTIYNNIPYAICGRTLHECVDWNVYNLHVFFVNRVALYTSAWIEIWRTGNVRRTPCVALYTSAWIEIKGWMHACAAGRVALYTSAWIEISNTPELLINTSKSHSTRVRGLKFREIETAVRCFSRTLHECVDWNNICLSGLAVSNALHSTRVRGLKYWWCADRSSDPVSHSTRVRGLKCFVTNVFLASYLVALYTSAWIEI